MKLKRIDKQIFFKMFELKLSLKIIFYILFIYQLFDKTKDYFHYNYSIELNLEVSSRILPSITVCIGKKHKDNLENWKNWENPYGNKTIVCVHKTGIENIFVECNEEKVHLRYRHKEVCLTFFNNINLNYLKIQYDGIFIALSSFKYKQQNIIIHPPDTLSHFEINNVFVSKGWEICTLNIRKVTRFTLPQPYSTDCNDYKQNRISTSPRSQLDCMFEYMKRKEMSKCGKNIYWNQYVIDNENQQFNFTDDKINECKVKFNYNLLLKLCKIDCINVKYMITITKSTNLLINPIAIIPIKKQYNINLLFKPKLTIVQFCSHLGGLISMYFGLSMINLAIIILRKLLRIRFVNIIKIIISIIFDYIIKLIFYLIMLYQLIVIIQSYRESNTQIKIGFTTENKLNKITLAFEPLIDIKRNNEYFPNFQQKYQSLQYTQQKYWMVHEHLFDVFLQNITTFAYITRLFDRKIECTMEFENNVQLDCGEIILSKIININSMLLFYNIPADNNSDNSTMLSNLKQIFIRIYSATI